MDFYRLLRRTTVLLAAIGLLGACGGGVTPDPTNNEPPNRHQDLRDQHGSFFGGPLFGGSSGPEAGAAGGGGIGVNGFLWRASLDTVSFIPISQADPFGGVIITDWYTPSETPEARFKLNVIILGRELRADGIRVSAFKQVRSASGEWLDAPVAPDTVTALENAILARARELRVATLAQR